MVDDFSFLQVGYASFPEGSPVGYGFLWAFCQVLRQDGRKLVLQHRKAAAETQNLACYK